MSPNKPTEFYHRRLPIRLKNDNANASHKVTKPAASPPRQNTPIRIQTGKYVTRHGDRLDIILRRGEYKDGGSRSFRIVRGLTPTDPTAAPLEDSSADEETTTEGLPYTDNSDSSSTDSQTSTDSLNDIPTEQQDSKQAQLKAYKRIYAIQPPQAGLQPQPQPKPEKKKK